MDLLFSYGTLQQSNVQLVNFGRVLEGTQDSLPRYVVGEIKITDERVIKASGKERHPILIHTGDLADHVPGTVFEVTDSELQKADDYEVDDYVRISAELMSGRSCWIYAAADEIR